MTVPLSWYIAVALVLFLTGIVLVLARRNLIYVLMGVELILNSASLNFVAFARYSEPSAAGGGLAHGTVFGLFIIVLAAAEAVVALAIVLNVFGLFHSVRPQDANLLRE